MPAPSLDLRCQIVAAWRRAEGTWLELAEQLPAPDVVASAPRASLAATSACWVRLRSSSTRAASPGHPGEAAHRQLNSLEGQGDHESSELRMIGVLLDVYRCQLQLNRAVRSA